VLVGGLPGSGKSTLARGLADRAGFEIIRSDVVRKELAGLRAEERGDPAIYSPEWTDRTYAECLRRAEERLLEGKRVIVDATFVEESRRRTFLDAAVRLGVPTAILACKAHPGVIRARLAARAGDASDADFGVHQTAAARWEDPGPHTRANWHDVPAHGDAAETLSAGLAALRGRGLN
jgi:predicted kinase